MCGISGIVNIDNKFDFPYKSLNKMNSEVNHRGPDGEGIFVKKNVGFGHTRLSIIDLSSKGNQPMHYRDRYTITYNGEIYNYIELRSKLVDQGYEFIFGVINV